MAAQSLQIIVLNIHGLRVNINTDDVESASFIKADFSRFLVRNDGSPASRIITIYASLSAPPEDLKPATKRPWIRTKDAAVYAWQGKRILDSNGKVLVTLQFDPDLAQIYSLDRNLLREKVYLMIMSRAGEWLDRRGLHRIHAMGVSYRGRAVICALPEGGGKTTLTLGLMSRPGFSLLSDEVPLVSRKGRLLCFPIRLGVREDAELCVPAHYLSNFKRARHEPKILIDAAYFSERISNEAEPGILLIGQRCDVEMPEITPATTLKAFATLWKLCVLGHGVPRLLEYVLRLRPGAVFVQLTILGSRTLACAALVRRSKNYILVLGRNRDANVALIEQLATEMYGVDKNT